MMGIECIGNSGNIIYSFVKPTNIKPDVYGYVDYLKLGILNMKHVNITEILSKHIKYVRRHFMKQKNTDTKSIQDDFDDDLNIGLDEPLSYERFHRLLEHAKQISNQENEVIHHDCNR